MIVLRSALNFCGIPEVSYPIRSSLSDNVVLLNVWTTSLDYKDSLLKSQIQV